MAENAAPRKSAGQGVDAPIAPPSLRHCLNGRDYFTNLILRFCLARGLNDD